MTYPLGLTKTLYNNFTDVKDEFLNIKQWAYDNDLGIIKPVFYAYLSADQTIADITTTTVALDTIDFDFNKSGGEYFDTANYRFVCPEGEEGYYLFIGNARMVSAMEANSTFGTWIYGYNKTRSYRGSFISISNTTAGYHATPSAAIMPMSAGDYAWLYCYHDSTGTKDLNGAAGDTFLSGFRICRSS